MQSLPPSEALCGSSLLYEYDPEAISSILSRLTLDTMRVQWQAKILASRCTQKDTSYGSPMELLPIDSEWLENWEKAIRPGDGSAQASQTFAAELGLHLPKPNPFIPEDLALKTQPSEKQELPAVLKGLEPPVACVFHRQDDTFKLPKAFICFYVYSPFLSQDVSSFTKADMWSRCVEEALQEYAYDAEVAGVGYSLNLGGGHLKLVLSGYNDKLGVLLDAVLEKITSMVEVPEHVFEIVADAYGDEVRNQTLHSPPYAQCSMHFEELTSRGSSYPPYKRLEAFEHLKCQDLKGLPEQIFAAGAHVEAVMLGNITADEARQLANRFAKDLKLEKPLSVLPERAEAQLLDGKTLWERDGTDAEEPNNAVFMRLQLPAGLEVEMLMRLLDKAISTKFFDILRTQNQLGYIVQMGATVGLKFPYIYAVVQTEFDPNYVRAQIDSFLEEHMTFAEEKLTEDEFEICKQGLLAELMTKPKNLSEEFGRYSRSINDRTYDFSRRKRMIEFLQTSASLDMLREFVKEKVRKAPRIYNQVKKISSKEGKQLPEGASLPTDPPDLRKWTKESGVVSSFHSNTKWHAINSAVDVTAKL
eukprot:TRINITY_DN7278_c2_g1_i1.p1 TRINITY_DN7278_c2_g1~~TRINITY_DN7278_c2_g1_i1.p1  ORF type:complete len:588 (+),score=154.18 TRINITY_DN7278_c2_g1_i1:1378-3141(+)